ncbi:MAG: hypothetical protein IK115_12070 [Lachnospiraceae bacterium]|nr:hypothetical protein [Lachnospiraceae bacterium]
MAEEIREKMNTAENTDPLVPGTYQIRKITSRKNSMELLATAEHLAAGGYDKKLFGVLSRVFTEHKGFHYEDREGMEELVNSIMASSVPSELKMQTFTSFEIPVKYKPDTDTVLRWVKECTPRRINIAGFFLAAYQYGAECYPCILGQRMIFRAYFSVVPAADALCFFEAMLPKENKETITGAVRMIRNTKRRFTYTDADTETLKRVTAAVFASREVFFTSKLLYCLAFHIPAAYLPEKRELYKMLKISISYEENTTRDFVKRYHLDFDLSEEAICKYLLGNKKSDKERTLVSRFAGHVVNVEDEALRGKLIHGAFKRGGLFRMYAGCMQDGKVDEQKQKRFHYTDEQIEWVKNLPGLKKE